MGVSLGQQVLQEQPWKRVLATQVSAVGGSGTSCLYLWALTSALHWRIQLGLDFLFDPRSDTPSDENTKNIYSVCDALYFSNLVTY